MKRFLLILGLTLCAVVGVQAQTHSATIAWTLSASAGVTSQNVYRAPCTGTAAAGACSAEGAFTKIASPGPAVTTYTDSTVAAATGYSYYLTAVCSTCSPSESVPSVHIAAMIPGNQPAPPTGPTITSVAILLNGTTETVVAKWTDPTGTQQDYRFSNGSQFVAQGLTSSASGAFAEEWTGPAGTAITFIACNSTGGCVSQKAQ